MIRNSARPRALRATLLVLACAAAYAAVLAAGTPARAVTSAGSILYDKAGDVWQTTPDGATVHQVTRDGGTPTSDNTGTSGYTVPTESDAGLIVAVRNQDYGSYQQGFLWVLDRTGKVLSKFKPPQFDLLPQFAGCPGPDAQFPGGIVNATVSPDGQHVAYTATAIGNAPNCQAISEVGSWVVDIDGTNGHWLSAGSGATADLEIGRWASSTRLLVDRFDFGSIQNYYVDLPSYTATAWAAPDSSDFIDEAYLQPDVANGILVTDGYSATSSAPVIRLWQTSGFGTQPTWKCEYPSVAHPNTTDVNLNQPSLSPDGVDVVFEDYQGSAPTASDEGIYLAPAAATLDGGTGCTSSTQTLFVQGAEDPFWTSAAITALPPDTIAPTVTLNGPTSAATVGTSTKVSWSGQDTGSGIDHYALRYRRAGYSSGFGAWTYPASWQQLTTTSLTATGLAAGYDYCYSVRAFDVAGNASAWSAARCTAVPLDDRSLARSTGWHLVTGSHFYDQTATTTKTLHAALTRSNASLDRVGLLATTCVGCGTVGVYVGAQLIGKVNLASTATHYRVLKMLSRFSTRSGTVSVKVLTSNRAVTVDGLLISRS